MILGVNEIHRVTPGDIVFVDHPKYYDKALNSAATIILINKEVDCPEGKSLLVSDDPLRDFNRIIEAFLPTPQQTASIDPTANIAPTAVIYPNVSIGPNVTIGANSIIYANVSIYANTTIGDNVIIHSNTTIGADPFYFQKRPQGFVKLNVCGAVNIADNVEIGANTTVDRGLTCTTHIGEGSKLDNHIHIGHDVVIGKRCLLAAHVGISGYSILEDNVILWGKVGVNSKVSIGEGAEVLGDSGIVKSLAGGKTYWGTPAIEAKQKHREIITLKRLASGKTKSKA